MHTKFEHPRPNSSCYILPTRIVDDATYGRTDGRKDGQSHTIIRPSNDGRIKTHDKLGIKQDELHMCCCRPMPRVYFDIVVLVCGTE